MYWVLAVPKLWAVLSIEVGIFVLVVAVEPIKERTNRELVEANHGDVGLEL